MMQDGDYQDSLDVWDLIKEENPKFNPIIAKGIVVEQFKQAEKYLDKVFEITSRSFPPGLVYKGIRRCTPQEEVNEINNITKAKSNRTIELSRSSVYMVYVFFEFNGEPLNPKAIWLPYLQQAGQFYLRGTLNTMSPIMVDSGLSVSGRDIFVGFLSGKVTFVKGNIGFYMNDQVKNTYYIHGKIHNVNYKKLPHYEQKRDDSIRMNHATVLYLFGKYGFKGTVKKFLNVDIEVSDEGFPEEQYPRDQWIICRSTGVKPRAVKTRDYLPNDIQIAVRKDDWSRGLEGLIAGFYYVTDCYTARMKASWTESTDAWRVILLHAVYRTTDTAGKLLLEAQKHFDSVDNYLDDVLKLTLESNDIYCENIYDLLFYLVENLSQIVIQTDTGNLYGKMLVILRYALSNIIEGINNFKFAITSGKRQLEKKDIARELGKNLQVDAIFKTSNHRSSHNEITAEQCAGDNIMFKYTSKIVPQEKATQKKSSKGGKESYDKPNKLYHVSVNEICSVAYTPKSDPTSRSVLNPYQITGADGVLRPRPEFKPILKAIHEKVKRY